MTPALRLSSNPYADDAGLRRVMDALGGPAYALLVGGAVRAAVLGDRADDMDIATTWEPHDVQARLQAAGIKALPTGIEHGTITAVVDRQPYEVTTLRRDVATDGRRAVVAFTTSWLEDAQRRDFTMNTLLMDMDGQVFDPTGQGVADLQQRYVRFVGDADLRIREDALRILRYFRFHARYGGAVMDKDAYQACVHNRHLIANLSRERVTQEVERLLVAPSAAKSISAMIEGDILGEVWNDSFNQSAYMALQKAVRATAFSAAEIILFAYSVYQKTRLCSVENLENFFVLLNRKKSLLNFWFDSLNQSAVSTVKLLYRHGHEATIGLRLLSLVINGQCRDVDTLKAEAERVAETAIPVLPVGAKDIMAQCALPPGPQIGLLMKEIEAWWLEGGATASREDALGYGQTRLKTTM